jgi:hypothetical protein
MPGTLVITTLSDGTNSTSATNCIQGSAKVWINFDGTGTPAIRGSYNVSSITDNGTGDYTVNFTNALADANYAMVAATGNGNSPTTNSAVASQVELGTLAQQTTTSVRFGVGRQYSPYTNQDITQINIAIFR